MQRNGGAEAAAAQLGFTFSFPCEQTALAAGKLIAWTKGFSCVDGPGLDVVELLAHEFRARRVLALSATPCPAPRPTEWRGCRADERRGLALEVAALVNDTVGTLAAAAFTDSDAEVGVILGTGAPCRPLQPTRRSHRRIQHPPARTCFGAPEQSRHSWGR